MLRPDSDAVSILRTLGLADVDAVTPWLGGSDTAIWRVERGGAPYALRLFRADEAPRCEWEVAAMGAAAAAGLPAPEVHAQGVWQERPALLLSWLPGRPLVYQVLRHPWRARSLAMAFGRTQAAIHAVRAPEALKQHRRPWTDRIGAEEEQLRGRLREIDQGRDALLHLDYHPLNVLAEGRRITGVLDWANTAVGDPRIDVARTRTILRLDRGTLGRPRLLGAPLAPLWLTFERGWWEGYREAAGPVEDMALFYAAAGSFMERDLSHRYTAQQLGGVRRWTERWKGQAGLSE